jgi:hypothetical protein
MMLLERRKCLAAAILHAWHRDAATLAAADVSDHPNSRMPAKTAARASLYVERFVVIRPSFGRVDGRTSSSGRLDPAARKLDPHLALQQVEQHNDPLAGGNVSLHDGREAS